MKTPQKNALEWTVFVISLALIAAVIGAIGWEAATREDRPAALTAETKPPVRLPSGAHGIEVIVRNEGDRTAEGVQVRVGDATVLEIPHVPRGSSRTVWATFEEDPGDVKATILGYNAP